MASYVLRNGTVQGVKHVRQGMNNQDASLVLEFGIRKWQKRYRIGLVSDGCSGIPAFTHSEVGAWLIVLYCMARIQEFIVGGTSVEEIPRVLYPSMTGYLRSIANDVMPPNIHWPYPAEMEFGGVHAFRNQLGAGQRFMTDFLMATVLGFIDDGENLVTFQAGDGVRIVNDDVHIVDQNDEPEYPAMSINSPGSGFNIQVYPSSSIRRIAIWCDGIEELLEAATRGRLDGVANRAELIDTIFAAAAKDVMGLQYCLNKLRKQRPDLLGDDCTGVTMERLEGDVE